MTEQCVEQDWIEFNNLVADGVLGRDLDRFIDWDTVRFTMFCIPAETALYYLKTLPDWETKWKPAIEEEPIGNPIPYETYPSSNGAVIHQANHLALFFAKTKCKLENLKTVFEFGAGYGCMCRLIYNLGFSGKYVIADLPAVLKLQQYYLGRALTGKRITYLLEVEDFVRQMEVEGESLFIGTWSLSEVSYTLREKVLRAVCNNVDYILLAFQDIHRGFDNLDFFVQFIRQNPKYHWDLLKVPHIPQNEQYYLFGERKG